MASGASRRVLKQSGRRLIRSLLVSVGFTAVGITMIAAGQRVTGWLVVGFFGVLGLPITVFQLLRRPTLTLTPDGFEYVPGVRSRATRRTWHEISEVYPVLGRAALVGWDAERADHPQLRKFNKHISGTTESIPAWFAGLTTEQVAALMNEYRTAALGADG